MFAFHKKHVYDADRCAIRWLSNLHELFHFWVGVEEQGIMRVPGEGAGKRVRGRRKAAEKESEPFR